MAGAPLRCNAATSCVGHEVAESASVANSNDTIIVIVIIICIFPPRDSI